MYNLFTKLLNNDLNEQGKKDLAAARKQNPDEVRKVEKAWELGGNYKSSFNPNSAEAFAKFQQRINAEANTTTKVVTMKPRFQWLKVAAAAVVLLTASVFAFNALTGDAAAQMAVVTTQEDEVRVVALPDGTEVTLNENSSLTYPETFADAEYRKVKLNGEAFFDVTRNESQPFIIQNPHTSIRVLGTSFNVRAYAHELTEEVHVKTGRVAFADKRNSKNKVLTANQKAVFKKETKALQATNTDDFNDMAYKTGTYKFKGAKLTEVIAAFERCYNITVDATNLDAKNCPYTTTLKNANLESAMEGLAIAFDIKVAKNNDTYTLTGGKSCD